MTRSNLSEYENQELFQKLMCSPDLVLTYQIICLTVINVFLSITAILGNTLILAALQKESSIHPPSKLLLRSLATTDLCVGLISEPLHIIYEMSLVNERWNICRYAVVSSFLAGYILGSVSLLTLTAISVDRLLALLLGLRYRQIVTFKGTCITITAFWVFSTVATTMYFWNYLITFLFTYLVISLCLITSSISYTKIFLALRHSQSRVHEHVRQEVRSRPILLNMPRYRKAVTSALLLQLTLAVCYLPHGIVTALWTKNEVSSSLFLARQCTVTVIYLNSSINPILYCWKIIEVRQAVKSLISTFYPLSS